MDVPKDKKEGLLLRIITPAGIALETACSSVLMPLADDKNGKGGGSIGVRHGHIDAVMALSEGTVRAGGLCVDIGAGLASVENDTVTVICERAEKLETGSKVK